MIYPVYPVRITEKPPNRALRFIARSALCIVIAGLFFSMGACYSQIGAGTKQPQNILLSHSGNYDTSANITYKDLRATATITQETPKACSVVFTSPPSLTDMTFVFRKDAVDLGYKGLSFTFDPSSMPGGIVAKMAVSSINKAMKDDGVGVDYTDGVLSLSGMMESGEFILRLDAENGNLLKLLVPGEELEIEFVNFRFLD